jgi:hypothetical protein
VRLPDALGLTQFLVDYPGMAIRPSRNSMLVLKGKFSFSATPQNGPTISDSYDIEISVPQDFPSAIPRVRETAKRIPRNGDYHINPDDTLCLGSPLRLLQKISQGPTLAGFVGKCLVPYLYAVTYKLENGGRFIFDELAHGTRGVLDDYMNLLGLDSEEQVIKALQILSTKHRAGNKMPCPCACGRSLGRCRRFNARINELRKLASRSWYKEHLSELHVYQ